MIIDSLLNKIINIALYTARKINSEPIDLFNDSLDKIKSIIKCKINKYYYSFDSTNKFNIFYLCSEIFFSLLNYHPLINGNKRVAFSILIEILYYFGFYFKYTKGNIIDYNWNKNKIKEFIINYQDTRDYNNAIDDIYNWILENIIVSLNFSNKF